MTTKLLDCTIRDGGYINNWNFSLDFAKALYRSISQSNVDYIEIGFFYPKYQGDNQWEHCSRELIQELKSSHPAGAKIAVMINQGTVTEDEIPNASDYGADMIRIATPAASIPEAIELSGKVLEKGYESTVNFMGISNFSPEKTLELAHLVSTSADKATFFYVADSFGSILPSHLKTLLTIMQYGSEAKFGFHPHNNMQLALANSLVGIDSGIDIVDASMCGMGRGGGNLNMEAILAVLETRNPEQCPYKLMPALSFSDLFMKPIKEKYSWGYSEPQLLSGVLQCHPNYVTELERHKYYTTDDIYHILKKTPMESKSRFSKNIVNESVREFHIAKLTSEPAKLHPDFEHQLSKSKKVILVCGGGSVSQHQERIESFKEKNDALLYTINTFNANLKTDGVFFGNRRRLLQHHTNIPKGANVILGHSIESDMVSYIKHTHISRPCLDIRRKEVDHFDYKTPTNSGLEAALLLMQLGTKEIFLAGLDGYSDTGDCYYYHNEEIGGHQEPVDFLNQKIEAELRALSLASIDCDSDFSIITPTIFKNFYKNLLD